MHKLCCQNGEKDKSILEIKLDKLSVHKNVSKIEYPDTAGKTMAVTKVENVTPGIKNPHVFDEPDICKHIQVVGLFCKF